MNKNIAISALVVIALLFGSIMLTGNSMAFKPEMTKVNMELYYENGSRVISFASSSTQITISTISGSVVQTLQGSAVSANLPYGVYKVKVSQDYTFDASTNGYVLSEPYSTYLNLSSQYSNQTLYVPVEIAHTTNVSISGLGAGKNVTLNFQTPTGFNFLSVTKNVSSFTEDLPVGVFYVNAIYGGEPHIYTETITAHDYNISIPLTTSSMFGVVYSSTGAQITQVNVVILNTTSLKYTSVPFQGNTFSVFIHNYTGKIVIITSPGYAPYQIKAAPGQVSIPPLSPAYGSVSTMFSVGNKLGYANETVTMHFSNSTTVPFLPNSTVGSLYWQEKLDNIGVTAIHQLLSQYMGRYTNSTFMINGNPYILRFSQVDSISVNPSNLTAVINATYNNSALYGISTLKNASIYATATSHMPGQLNYTYSLYYSNTSIALKSSNYPTSTYRSPINISTQPTSRWVKLQFTAVKGPTFVDSYTSLYWSGLNSSNYILNSSINNTVFVAPVGQQVYINISKAYFNPVTGTNDYSLTKFTWKIDGSAVSTQANRTYNISYTFSSNDTEYTVLVNATSPSGGTNQTTFYVYAFQGKPEIQYSVNYSNKVHYSGSYNSSGAMISVPQNSLILFSVYNSSAKVANYSVPLIFKWSFVNFTTASPNASYKFAKPDINASAYQEANVTVTTITGQALTLLFKVHVNDTTPSSPFISIFNATGKKESNPVAGQVTNFSAMKTKDPYYSFSQLKFHWQVLYGNGSLAPVNSSKSVYTIVNGSLNGSWVKIEFTTLNDMEISLKVTNPSNITSYANLTLTMVVNTPRLVVNSVYVPGGLVQGKKTTLKVNVTNDGKVTADSFYLMIKVGGTIVVNQTYTMHLAVNANANLSLNWTPSQSGTVTIQVMGSNYTEPAFFATAGSISMSVSISPPSYVTPLIIVAVILVIVVVGSVYYKLSTGGFRKKNSGTAKTSLIEQKKQQEKQQEKKNK